MKLLHLTLRGMSCDHCVATISRAVEAVPGVSSSQVQINRADIQFDETRCNPAQVIQAIRSSGAFDVLGFQVESSP